MSGIHFKIDAETVRTIAEEWRREQVRREEAEKRKQDLILQTFAPYVPMLVNVLVGDKPVERDPLIGAFLNSISAEQLAKITPLLTNEQMVMMMQLVDQYIPPETKPQEDGKPEESGDKKEPN